MSLNTVTSGVSGVGSQLPNQVESVTDNAQKVTEKPLQQVQDTTGDVTDDIMPGEFPSDDQPSKQSEPQGEISVGAIWTAFSGWICGLFPGPWIASNGSFNGWWTDTFLRQDKRPSTKKR
ncbi:hypothetical protein N7468_004495 [Penicillium chermesinum]|uniref:Uncharacterized protein n=1 Tax=Penicillium chermesinum TaxID=63820 RepID=A0A9W9P9B0_9EURO|nr:uncharacterized protein N7468_004495 [Penicillium chermesinum]KAJ5239876.1 hypothetical protein N7468_004495 [Penicillium chermesinum]